MDTEMRVSKMSLNAKREIPFDFRVFEMEGTVWLVDWSERTYPCSTRPHNFCEPLYDLDGEDYDHDPAYLLSSELDGLELIELDLDPDDVGADTDEQEAWDTAREEAQGNHRI